MLRFFQNNNILMLVLFPVIAVLLSLAIPEEIINKINPENQAHFYKQILFLIRGDNFIVFYKILIAFFFMLNGLLFNKFILSIKICKSNNFFFGLLFLILIGPSSIKIGSLAVLIALLIFIAALIIIFRSLRKPLAIFDFLNAGMLISFSFLFWVNIVFFVPIIFVGLFVLRDQQWREWISALIGLVLPLFFFLSIYFLLFSNVDIVYNFLRLFSEKSSAADIDVIQIIAAGYIVFLTVVFSIKIISRFNSLETDSQDYYKVFFLLFINSIVILLVNPTILYSIVPFSIPAIVIPLGIGFMQFKRKIFPELLFLVFLTLVVLVITDFTL